MSLAASLFKFCKNIRLNETKSVCYSYSFRANYCSKSVSVRKYDDCNALQPVSEDLSTIAPFFSNTYNLAAYVNYSDTLKNLVNLNVDISKIEKKTYVVEKLLKLDFEKDMKNHIIFLSDYVGMDEVGNFITKNPLILCEALEDLKVRVNYLESKGFKDDQIHRILSVNPFWLMFSTIRIDRRFGFFQKTLSLCGDEVRSLATKKPNLITYNLHHIKTNLFVVKEEMGFEDSEVKVMVLNKPKLLMLNQRNLQERFNYFHNIIKISHQVILEQPEILLCRNFRVKQRHLLLKKFGRAQFDPMKENYVPVKSLVEGTDAEFCREFAKCSIDDFNLFLKTL